MLICIYVRLCESRSALLKIFPSNRLGQKCGDVAVVLCDVADNARRNEGMFGQG